MAREAVRQERSLFSPALFTRWRDPRSDVESWILSRRIAPLQQTFYFVNSGWSADGRYYWFYAAFPPAGDSNYGRTLAVIDFEEGEVRHFPEAQFLDASPAVDPSGSDAYWCNGLDLWKRGPGRRDPAVWVNRFPEALAKNRRPWRLATHLTFSADGRSVNLDAEIGREWFAGHAPLDGGPVEIWRRFESGHNHAQFSPTDPGLQLIAQDSAVDPVTGESPRYENRMWLLRQDGSAEPLLEGDECRMHGHEWWSADGRRVWYVHYGRGVAYAGLQDRRPHLAWPLLKASHAHCDAAERFLVADAVPSDRSESRVAFLNRETGRAVDIVSQLPHLPELRKYHIHPHPRFGLDDRYICYTTTVLGQVDIAFVRVADLAAATA